MSTLAIEIQIPLVQDVSVTEESLTVDLTDGRTVSAPLVWYPRLFHATQEERSNWRLIGKGEGVHWPDIDEDISVQNILAGKRSGESRRSFKKWLQQRTETKTKVL